MSQPLTPLETDASTQTPLADALARREEELRPQVEKCCAELHALPRRSRRALQRRLARSRDLTAILEGWLQRGAGRTLQRQLARSLAGAALLLALVQGVGQAATITVTTNIPRVHPGDGKCSLIEAILNANAGAQLQADCAAADPAPMTNTIVMPKSIHTLATTYGGGENGLPLITSAITIEGNGATITRRATAPPFRLIQVDPSGNLTLRNVTLSGGNASYAASNAGGAIENAGIVTIQNSTVTGNKALFAGGIENVSAATLTVENSTISKNAAVAPNNGVGGGIENYKGTVIIHNSTITGNQSGVTAGQGTGGGIENNSGTLTIENSTISGNKANGSDYGYGGGVNNLSLGPPGIVTIINSTISKNGSGGTGGGITNMSSMLIQNSTISGNKAGKKYGYGGGIENVDGASLTIENSTISGNQANGTVTSSGGGIENSGGLTLSRSLISGNKAALGREAENFGRGGVAAGNYNLFGSRGDAGILGFSSGGTDIVPSVGVVSILGLLKNNGGPTFTHALKRHSPAVDAVPSSDPACTGTDQRGVSRPQPAGGNCDIGSFELR